MAASMITLPFDSSSLPFEVSSKKWIEIGSDSELYKLVLQHIAVHPNDTLNPIQSFTADAVKENQEKTCCDPTSVASKHGRIGISAGVGIFSFNDHVGNVLYGLHQYIGNPVGTSCGAKMFQNLIVFTDKDIVTLCSFLTHLIDQSQKTQEGIFICFKWHNKFQYWQSQEKVKARPLDSVILPSRTKSHLMGDLERFLNPKTKSFFEVHGIPYRRSYLFHGIPGAGKTSLIQALAGHLKRSISYLQPTHPDFTDDALRAAMNRLPSNTIVVFEDIDSLFAKDRSNKVAKSSLTFSGLLNALDGVGSSSGQIFILTTNLRDQLDPALIRYGRVDVHIEFTDACAEQMETMWTSFYPDAANRSTEFSSKLITILGDRKIATAGLQHFFVTQMMSTADEAMSNLELIIEDMKSKEQNEESEEVKKKQNKKKGTKQGSKGGQKSSDTAKSGKSTVATESRQIHIHVHVHDDADRDSTVTAQSRAAMGTEIRGGKSSAKAESGDDDESCKDDDLDEEDENEDVEEEEE